MEEPLDKYFEKGLSANERKQLTEMLENDPELKKELDFRKRLQGAIHQRERRDLKLFVKGFENNRSNRRYLLYGGVALVLIFIGLVFVRPLFLKPDPEALYLSYFEPFPNMIAPDVRSSETPVDTEEAFRLYDTGRYELAARRFHTLALTGTEDYLPFYEGISQLAAGNASATIALWEKIIFKDEAVPMETYRRWYLALAYLKTGQKEKAVKELDQLSRHANPQQAAAFRLLKELR